jgi:hypothetical protein
MRFAFIAKHRHIWPVSSPCEVLEVSRSGFHAWLGRPTSAHEIQDAKLVTEAVSPVVVQEEAARGTPGVAQRAAVGDAGGHRRSSDKVRVATPGT